MTEIRCPSCTVVEKGEPENGEHFYATKQRLRVQLHERCPRSPDFPCPMRGTVQHSRERLTP